MALGDIFRVTPVWFNLASGENLQTHFDIEQATAVPLAIADVGQAVVDWWDVAGATGGPQKQYHNSQTQLDHVEMRSWDPLSPAIQVFTPAAPIPGTGGGTVSTFQACILVSKRTDLAGRRFRGRNYLPAPDEAVTGSSGFLTALQADDIRDAREDLLAAFDALFATEVVYSTVLGSGEPVTRFRVDRRIRTQRRRAIEAPLYSS